MTRTEENNNLLEDVRKELNENPLAEFRLDDIKILMLMDISKSLAIIADGLRKEVK